MIEFSVRPATVADYEDLCRVWEVGDLLHRQALPHIFHSNGPSQGRATIEALIAGSDSAILVAEASGAVIGLATIVVRTVSETAIMIGRRYVEIDNMAVTPSAQRNGIGRALIDAAERWAREQGITELKLQVYEFNQTAQEFYRAMGFQSISRQLTRGSSN